MKAEVLRKASKHADTMEHCAVCEVMQLRYIAVTGYFYAAPGSGGGSAAAPRTDIILKEDDPAFETIKQLLMAKVQDARAEAEAGLIALGIKGHEVDRAVVEAASAKSLNAKQEYAAMMAVAAARKQRQR